MMLKLSLVTGSFSSKTAGFTPGSRRFNHLVPTRREPDRAEPFLISTSNYIYLYQKALPARAGISSTSHFPGNCSARFCASPSSERHGLLHGTASVRTGDQWDQFGRPVRDKWLTDRVREPFRGYGPCPRELSLRPPASATICRKEWTLQARAVAPIWI